jgi:hypothetical protein
VVYFLLEAPSFRAGRYFIKKIIRFLLQYLFLVLGVGELSRL